MTDDKLIVAVGIALFGERYKQDLANALNVSRDTVDDWTRIAPGKTEPRMKPKPGVWADLAQLVADRHKALTKLAPMVDKRIA